MRDYGIGDIDPDYVRPTVDRGEVPRETDAAPDGRAGWHDTVPLPRAGSGTTVVGVAAAGAMAAGDRPSPAIDAAVGPVVHPVQESAVGQAVDSDATTGAPAEPPGAAPAPSAAAPPGSPAAETPAPEPAGTVLSAPEPAGTVPAAEIGSGPPAAAPAPTPTAGGPAAGHGDEGLGDAAELSDGVTVNDEDLPLAMEARRAVQILNPGGEVMMPRPAHPRTICVANQKGGVGKTTTAVNLAVALALHGNRVLVVDLDPQGNASTGLNVPHHAGVPDIYDCLIDSVGLADVAQPVEGIPNLQCVPATIDLAGAEIELVSVVARESRLARAIEAYPHEYDYLLIDCPPSLGVLTVNALVATKEVLIPIQCEYYALEGLNQLLSNISMVQAHLNPALEISTILLTMYDRRTRLADAVEQDVRQHFGDKVLDAVIPRNVRVSEAPSYGQSVMTYDPGSRGATSYFEAAQEIAERGAKQGEGE